ncbi:MAG: anion permease [Clostridia bacterium]|nr:anion permease [Clostridia bacterium]
MSKVIDFVKKEAVLCVSAVLAVVSMFFVPPSAGYAEYIDFHTLSLLMCLMTVMVGLRKIGVFSVLTGKLISMAPTLRRMVFVLVMLCFFFSMAVTNDVALITFVPFAIEALTKTGHKDKLIYVIVLQTIAANLGSMLTPIGNPQNLYLYSLSGMGAVSFIQLMMPYTVVSLVLTLVCIMFVKSEKVSVPEGGSDKVKVRDTVFYLVMFALSLLAVANVLPYWIVLIAVVVMAFVFDKKVLIDVDYSLLLTFVFFFVFIGNMGNIEWFSTFVSNAVSGSEVLVSVLASQVISNVPAALLLSGFTERFDLLVVGTNLGGLGTIIASMASLISYKYFAQTNGNKMKYLGVFTVMNVAFLIILYGTYIILK